MQSLINQDNKHLYTINDYTLKVLQGTVAAKAPTNDVQGHSLQSFDDTSEIQATPVSSVRQEETTNTTERDALVEALKKKAEELGDKLTRKEIQYDTELERHDDKIKLAKDQGY